MHDGRSLHGRHRDAPNGRVYDRGVVPTLVIRLLGPPEIERDGPRRPAVTRRRRARISAAGGAPGPAGPPGGASASPPRSAGAARSSRCPSPRRGAPPESAGLGHVDLVAQGLAILALLAWTGAIGAAGGALMRQRDVQ